MEHLQSILQNVVSVIAIINYDVTMSFPLKFLHLRSIVDFLELLLKHLLDIPLFYRKTLVFCFMFVFYDEDIDDIRQGEVDTKEKN